MIVYHGSWTEIDNIDLAKCKANRDFGKGFYVTRFIEQAKEWANIIGSVNNTQGCVTEFTFYERALDDPSISALRFSNYNDEWFDFIILNRDLNYTENRHSYDIIEGPVADDKIQRRIELFLNGKITREEFFRQIKFEAPSHQICFCTLNSLRMLNKAKDNSIFEIEEITDAIIEELMQSLLVNETKAAEIFYSSATFAKISDISSKLYEKDWKEIFALLMEEIKENIR